MEGRNDGGKTAKLLLIGKISNVGRLLIGGNRDRETIPVGTRYTLSKIRTRRFASLRFSYQISWLARIFRGPLLSRGRFHREYL